MSSDMDFPLCLYNNTVYNIESHCISNRSTQIPQLRVTYHVGEDFLDLVSGIRAIDEAIKFLNMKCGDRLGHAIALGIDVQKWYQNKNYRILLPQQEYLDNIAWLYYLLSAFQIEGYESTKTILRKEFQYYFKIIYRNAMKEHELHQINKRAREYYHGTEWERYYYSQDYDFSIETYYYAWTLRGDNPELYKTGYFQNQYINQAEWGSFASKGINNSFPKKQVTRYFQEVGMLYYFYHYNWEVRQEGEKPIEIKMTKNIINCIETVQKEMQKKVAALGICIETNPSSNYSISTFKRYDEHPIVNFYNQGLVEEELLLKNCPQINVSINTDDAGVFSTSLENEYALIALALEKKKNSAGEPIYKKQNIYRWLNNIRKMGMNQTFLTDDEREEAIRNWKEYNNL